jgi:hypothetical protein
MYAAIVPVDDAPAPEAAMTDRTRLIILIIANVVLFALLWGAFYWMPVGA